MKADFEKGTKECSKCKRELPISEFNKNKRNLDGLEYYCKECKEEYLKEYRKTPYAKQRRKVFNDKRINTFGRAGNVRGNSNVMKRDYELTEEQLKRRNKKRKYRNSNRRCCNHGLLIWYDETLDSLSTKEYRKVMNKEYARQMRCVVNGYIGRTKPSEHFLFDFDLEQMLKDNVYYGEGEKRNYITKWWKGEIKHWTVNDGIWKE